MSDHLRSIARYEAETDHDALWSVLYVVVAALVVAAFFYSSTSTHDISVPATTGLGTP